MKRINFGMVALVVAMTSTVVSAEHAQPMGMVRPGMMKMGGPTIDIPVMLKEAKVALSINMFREVKRSLSEDICS